MVKRAPRPGPPEPRTDSRTCAVWFFKTTPQFNHSAGMMGCCVQPVLLHKQTQNNTETVFAHAKSTSVEKMREVGMCECCLLAVLPNSPQS